MDLLEFTCTAQLKTKGNRKESSMKKLIIICVLIAFAIIPLLFSQVIWGKTNLLVDNQLQLLLDEKEKIIQNGESVPQSLDDKIKQEMAYQDSMQDDLLRCSEEIKTNQSQISQTENNTNKSDATQIMQSEYNEPNENIGYIGVPGYAMKFFPSNYKELNFNSMAISSYNILISGSYKSDGRSFIVNVASSPKSSETERIENQFTDVHEIIFINVLDDKNVIIFSYDGDKQGYVDLGSGEIIFK